MSNLSFNIASGKSRKQKGGAFSASRIDRKEINELVGKGIGRDILASAVSAILPKIINSVGTYATDKLSQKIKGGKKCGGSYRLH